MFTKEKANAIIGAMMEDDGDKLKEILSASIQSGEMTKDEANSLISAMQEDDGDKVKGILGSIISKSNLAPPTAPTAQTPTEKPEEGLQWGAMAESLFPRLVREGETDFTPANVAKNVGLGLLDTSTMLGRHTKELLGLGRAEDVGIDPNAGAMTQLGQGVLNDPLLMFGGGVSKGALMATEKALPTMGKLGQGLVSSSIAGAGLGAGSNAILSANQEADFAPLESAGMGALGGALGASAGAVGSKIVQKMGLGAPEAIAPKTMAEQAQFNRLSPSQKIDANVQQAMKRFGMTEAQYKSQPNELRLLAEKGELDDDAIRQLNSYINEGITGDLGDVSIANKEGERILSGMRSTAENNRMKIGDEFNAIESKTFTNEPIDVSPILKHFGDVVEKNTGYRPSVIQSVDENGNPFEKVEMVKVKSLPSEKGGEMYKTAQRMAEYLHENTKGDITAQDLRDLEIQLKKDYLDPTDNKNLKDKEKLIAEFVSGKPESLINGTGDEIAVSGDEGRNSILGLIREQVAKSPDVTPEELARYDELRNEYRKSMRVKDLIEKQAGKPTDFPDQEGTFHGMSANFLRRFVSGQQDQSANALAKWYMNQGGENAIKTAHLVTASNALIRSHGGAYSKKILHSGGGIPTKEGIIQKAWEAVTPKPKTPLQSFEKPRSQTAPAKATQKLGSALKGQPTALGAMGAAKEQKKPKKQSGNGTLNDVMTRAFKLNPTR